MNNNKRGRNQESITSNQSVDSVILENMAFEELKVHTFKQIALADNEINMSLRELMARQEREQFVIRQEINKEKPRYFCCSQCLIF